MTSTTRRVVDRSGPPLLSVRDLRVHFPTKARRQAGGAPGLAGRAGSVVKAVDGVDFDIWPGETLGLVGESGCGKSTTGRAILRLLDQKVVQGDVRFDGQDVQRLARESLSAFRGRAQIVFQDPVASLNPRMSVNSMLGESLAVRGVKKSERPARVVELLERVGLGAEHLDRYPHEFSGGQRQRLGIARALSVEPDLLILDEPVSALDVSVRAEVVNLLADLQAAAGLTYLFIAHDLALVEHVSDRIAVMYLGRIVETADAEALYRDPRHPYTQSLLSAIPRPDPAGRESRERIVLHEEPAAAVASREGCPFAPRCPSPLKDETCVSVVPATDASGDGHFAACHHQRSG